MGRKLECVRVTTKPKSAEKYLGVWFDDLLSFTAQVNALSATCFGILRSLKTILGFFHPHVRKMVVQSLITSRLDYCTTFCIWAFAGI